MLKLDASKSGAFRIGGEIEVHRLGFGAMRITGPGIWGPPADKAERSEPSREFPSSGSISSTPPTPMGLTSPSSSSARHFIPMTAFLSPPRPDCGDPNPVHGIGMVVRNTCANRQSKAGNGLGLSRLDSGSYTASIRKCHATSSSQRSSHCKMKGSSAVRGLATFRGGH
jgi:hypothetical protein